MAFLGYAIITPPGSRVRVLWAHYTVPHKTAVRVPALALAKSDADALFTSAAGRRPASLGYFPISILERKWLLCEGEG